MFMRERHLLPVPTASIREYGRHSHTHTHVAPRANTDTPRGNHSVGGRRGVCLSYVRVCTCVTDVV